MKGKGSPILVMVGLVFLAGWSATAEPPATLGTDEIKQEDGSGIGGSRPPSPEHAKTHEQELQEDHEALHQHDAGTHEHGADTHQHDSGAGEHMTGSEGMDSHSGMHDTGRMGGGTEGNHGGRMRGGH